HRLLDDHGASPPELYSGPGTARATRAPLHQACDRGVRARRIRVRRCIRGESGATSRPGVTGATMTSGAIAHLASTTEFRTGLGIGLALAVGVLLVLVDQPKRRIARIAGLLIATGFATGIAVSSDLPANVLPRIACLAAGGW